MTHFMQIIVLYLMKIKAYDPLKMIFMQNYKKMEISFYTTQVIMFGKIQLGARTPIRL